MKKTYAAPTLVANGSAVRETMGGINSGAEDVKRPLAEGSVGFYL
ncbi:MAG: hypothetical protein ACREOC_05270 [Gemmatimonadales bacterium]